MAYSHWKYDVPAENGRFMMMQMLMNVINFWNEQHCKSLWQNTYSVYSHLLVSLGGLKSYIMGWFWKEKCESSCKGKKLVVDI